MNKQIKNSSGTISTGKLILIGLLVVIGVVVAVLLFRGGSNKNASLDNADKLKREATLDNEDNLNAAKHNSGGGSPSPEPTPGPGGDEYTTANLVYDKNELNQAKVPSKLLMTYQEAVILENPESTPEGYSFQGWYYDKNCTIKASKLYKPVNTVPQERTLYAKWQSELHFDANAGIESVSALPDDIVMNKSSKITIPSNTPVRAGYIFDGWATDSSATEGEYTKGSIFKNVDEYKDTTTLYAVWKEQTATLTYDVGEGTLKDPTKSKYTMKYSAATVLLAADDINLPPSNGFVEWNTEADGSGEGYQQLAEYKKKNIMPKAETLYAIYGSTDDTVTQELVFDANGHGEVPYGITVTMKYSEDAYVAAALDDVTGYDFYEWNTKSDGTGISYKPGDLYKAANISVRGNGSTVYLYAIWDEKAAVLSYNANGHGTAPKSQVMMYSKAIFAAPAIQGEGTWGFVEWNTKSDGTGTKYPAGTEFKGANKLPKTTVLYAIWYDNSATATLKYDSNGHVVTPPPAVGLTYSNKVTAATALSGVKGYTFVEWNTKANGTGISYMPNEVFKDANVVPKENVTLYAIWAEAAETLSYEGNFKGLSAEAVAPVDLPAPVTMRYSERVLTATALSPYNANSGNQYGFKEWNTKADGTGTSYPADTEIKDYNVVPQKTTLYAQWVQISDDQKAVETATLSYDSNGKTVESMPANQGMSFNGAYNVAAAVRTAKISGSGETIYPNDYDFVEWNTKADGTGTSYAPESEFKRAEVIPQDTTLYAIWAEKKQVLRYVNSHGSAPEAQILSFTKAAKISSLIPEDDGDKAFAEWNTDKDGNSTNKYQPGAIYKNAYSDTGMDSVVTLYAIYRDKTKTANLTYSTDDSKSGYVGAQTLKYSEEAIVKNGPTCKGAYIFIEWNTKGDGTGAGYQPGDVYKKANVAVSTSSQHTLFAIYDEKSKNITYHPNDGMSAEFTRTSKYTASTTVESALPAIGNNGFVEWNTQADGKGVSYPAGAKIKDAYVDPTDSSSKIPDELYAIWGDKTISGKLTYNANKKSATMPSDVTMNFDSEYTAAAMPAAIEGYTFVEWNTMADGNGITYNPGDTVKMSNVVAKNITLYAIWEEKVAKLTFDSNGHGTPPAPILMKYSEQITFNRTMDKQKIAEGVYVAFVEWNTKADGSGKSYAARSLFKAINIEPVETTLYAIWVNLDESVTGTYTFDANGHEGVEVPDPVVANYNKSVGFANLEDIEGYKFKEWNTEPNGSGTSYVELDGEKAILKEAYTMPQDMTLYAIWEEKVSTLSYSANGHGTSPASTTMRYSQSVKAASALPKDGDYGFVIWNTRPDRTGDDYPANAEVKGANKESDNITLYAIWKNDINDATLTYHSNGHGTVSAPVTLKFTTATNAANAPSNVPGYTFKEWNTKKDGTGIAYAAKAQVKAPTVVPEDIDLYAIWEEKTAPLTYDLNASAFTDPEIGDVTIPENAVLKYSKSTKVGDDPVGFDTDEYGFIEWNTKPDGTGIAYHKDDVLKDENIEPQDTTLYAIFKKKKQKLKFDGNSHSAGLDSEIIDYKYAYSITTDPAVEGEHVIKLQAPTDVASNYKFQGWSLTQKAGTLEEIDYPYDEKTQTFEAKTVQIKDANEYPEEITLYAVYKTQLVFLNRGASIRGYGWRAQITARQFGREFKQGEVLTYSARYDDTMGCYKGSCSGKYTVGANLQFRINVTASWYSLRHTWLINSENRDIFINNNSSCVYGFVTLSMYTYEYDPIKVSGNV